MCRKPGTSWLGCQCCTGEDPFVQNVEDARTTALNGQGWRVSAVTADHLRHIWGVDWSDGEFGELKEDQVLLQK